VRANQLTGQLRAYNPIIPNVGVDYRLADPPVNRNPWRGLGCRVIIECCPRDLDFAPHGTVWHCDRNRGAIVFRTVLVPLDGSVFAEQALPLAVSLARPTGAPLRLLRVVPPLADYLFWPPLRSDPLDHELREMHRAEAQGYLDSVVHRLKGAGPVTCDVVEDVMEEEEGICESIIADVTRTGADLIVVSSHGRGVMARFWLGSIADRLVRTAPVPVIVVRPPEHPHAPDLGRPVILKHLLLALDGTAMAERVVEPAVAIGKAAGADYTLVTALRSVLPFSLHHGSAGSGQKPQSAWLGSAKIDVQRRQKAEDYLSAVANHLRADGAKVQTRVHLAEQPAAAILHEATLVGADLIALETHGRGISRLLMGSVADKVVRGSSLPVLLCRLPHQASEKN
jgi:nucleotide-binding universal stress UspA family protein